MLTFGSEVPTPRKPALEGRDVALVAASASAQTRGRGKELPVIPRIVRRQSAFDAASPLLAMLGSVQSAIRRSGVGTMVVTGLALATVGTIASFGMRSLAEQSSVGTTAAVTVFDAKGTERVLARGALVPRTEQAPPKVVAIAPAPHVAVVPSHPVVTPSHVTSRPAAAHASLAPLVKPVKASHATVAYARR